MLGTYVRLRSVVFRTASQAPVCDDLVMPPTVLIVDDHPSFRASARAVLEADGFEIIGEAADGAAALVAVAELAPEVVLLDIQLPDMTGFDVCEGLARRNGTTPAVILVSSRDVSDYGDLIGDSHARGFVPKAELSGEAILALLA
jgi:DNA-binding NarL/FixJ family response regulator